MRRSGLSGKEGRIHSTGEGHTPFGGDIPATIWRTYMERAFALEPKKFPAVYDWPLPKNPVQWVPFHSQFPTFVPCTVKCNPKTTKGGGGTSGGTDHQPGSSCKRLHGCVQ